MASGCECAVSVDGDAEGCGLQFDLFDERLSLGFGGEAFQRHGDGRLFVSANFSR